MMNQKQRDAISRGHLKHQALRRLVAAARKVPIVRRADEPPFSTCLGCDRTEGDPCKEGCWVQCLESAIHDASVLLPGPAPEESNG